MTTPTGPGMDLRDGVPCFFPPDAEPQPLQRLSLMFRAGTADETLPRTGRSKRSACTPSTATCRPPSTWG